MIVDPSASLNTGDTILLSLKTFMRLPALQRSTVIFKDVLGYSLEEIAAFTASSIPAVKSALQRGRAGLKQLADTNEAPPALDPREHRLLAAYAHHFNARNFDAIRDMLADEVRLNLVNRLQSAGKPNVANYFGNYGHFAGWRLAPGMVDRKPALLVFDPDDVLGMPMYFVVLEWMRDRVVSIRDFRYARYVLEGTEIGVLPSLN